MRAKIERVAKKATEEVEEVETRTSEVDLVETDKLLDKIEEVLEDQERIEFKEKLRRWAKNQGRLSPSISLHGDDGKCPCCGWPMAGPPGPECLNRGGFVE